VSGSRDIRFESVWKSYPRWGGAAGRTLRGKLTRRIPGGAVPRDRRWALQDISCTFPSGLATGIIGANGAGKSTMLRLASGVGAPTLGRILLPANTASVLNLGYAFDATLSGRENAVTAALMSGMTAARARAALPQVLAFAELEAFAEAPLRTYSDGMLLRLAFGVIAQLRPDALLLDEVMAVGDLRFQDKCMDRIAEMRADGTTVVFASHSLEQVQEQCDRAIWLQGGTLRVHAEAAEVIEAYETAMRSETVDRTPRATASSTTDGLELGRNRLGSQEATIDSVRIAGHEADLTIRSGAAMSVRMEINAPQPIASPIAVVTVQRAADGTICADLTSEASSVPLGTLEGTCEVVLRFPRLELVPGDYVADVGLYERSWAYAYDLQLGAHPFTVAGGGNHKGVYLPAHGWTVERR